MINEEKILVLNKEKKDITANVLYINDFEVGVQYGEKFYPYKKSNLIIIENPEVIENCSITTATKKLSNIYKILKFHNYIKVFFKNGTNRIYHLSEITLEYSLLLQEPMKQVFQYLKELAERLTLNDIVQESETKNKNPDFLKKIYEKIQFISE